MKTPPILCGPGEKMVNKKILIVDDNKSYLEELKEVLEAEGFDAIPMVDSFEAYAVIYNILPDLILLDLRMDGMNGFQLASRIKETKRTSNIPIFAMSAFFDAEQHPGLIRRCGIQEYFTKPYDVEQIISKIRDTLEIN